MYEYLNSNIGKIIAGIILMALSNIIPVIGWLVWTVGAVIFVLGVYPYALPVYQKYVLPYVKKFLQKKQ